MTIMSMEIDSSRKPAKEPWDESSKEETGSIAIADPVVVKTRALSPLDPTIASANSFEVQTRMTDDRPTDGGEESEGRIDRDVSNLSCTQFSSLYASSVKREHDKRRVDNRVWNHQPSSHQLYYTNTDQQSIETIHNSCSSSGNATSSSEAYGFIWHSDVITSQPTLV